VVLLILFLTTDVAYLHSSVMKRGLLCLGVIQGIIHSKLIGAYIVYRSVCPPVAAKYLVPRNVPLQR
jgi:hypothetical protein